MIHTIRKAKPNDAAILSELAFRSKAYWGYAAEVMQSFWEELSVSPEKVQHQDFEYFVAEVDKTIAGFCALEKLSDKEYELEALFVDPSYMRNRIGAALLRKAKEVVQSYGGSSLIIQGDPNAVDFYEAHGAELVGKRESDSIPGRFLPLFEIHL